MHLFIKPKTELLPDSIPKKTRRQPARFIPSATSTSIVSTRDRHSQPMSTPRRFNSLQTFRRCVRSRVKQSSANQTREYPNALICSLRHNAVYTAASHVTAENGLLQKSHENGHPRDVIIDDVEYPKRSR